VSDPIIEQFAPPPGIARRSMSTEMTALM